MPHLDLIQSISLAGDSARANDDRAGMSWRHAWVIDGATDLGPPGLVGAQAGAAWLASMANGIFAAAPDAPLATVVEDVFTHLAHAYEAARTRHAHGRWELPSAAFLAVALEADALEVAWLADCACLLLRDGTVVRLGPEPTGLETEEARSAHATGLDLRAPTRSGATMERLRRSRERPERRVLGVEPAHAAAVHHARTPIRAGDELVMMTDGMAALIDDYGMPAADFVQVLASEGLHHLALRLREIESEDQSGAQHPRFKRSDDATALWLRVV